MTKKPKLTVKQARFVKAVAEGKPKYKAAMEAYDTNDPDTAAQIANQNLKKTQVQEALDIAFKKHGIDIDSVVAPVGKALKAKRIVIRTGVTTDEKGNKIEQSFAEEEEDIELQLKGHDRAAKLLNLYPARDPAGVNVNLNFGQVTEEMKGKYDD